MVYEVLLILIVITALPMFFHESLSFELVQFLSVQKMINHVPLVLDITSILTGPRWPLSIEMKSESSADGSGCDSGLR
jgi:hypothetical protein